MEKVLSTLLGVVIAIVASGVLFIGANKWFDLARRNWSWFSMVTGALISGLAAGVLAGNRVSIWQFSYEEGSTGTSAWLYVVIAIVAGGALGAALSATEGMSMRLLVGGGGGLVLGAFHGFFLAETAYPALQLVPLLVWPIGGAIVGYGLGMISDKPSLRRAVDFATIGWVFGTWLVPSIGGGTRVEAIVAMAVLGLGFGTRIAMTGAADCFRRETIALKSRATIFLFPSMLFISVSLIIPTLRTLWLSLLGSRSVEFVGLENFVSIFTDPGIFKTEDWAFMFTQELFIIGALFAAIGTVLAWRAAKARGNPPNPLSLFLGAAGAVALVIGYVLNYLADPDAIATAVADDAPFSLAATTVVLVGFLLTVGGILMGSLSARGGGHRLDWTPSNMGSLGVGVFFLFFGAFAALRGTIFNNLWWVVGVVGLATSLGLMIAVLADRSKSETIAKSLIFMPMAISFVGAGIIWRFMYIARPIQKDQTGIINTPWVWLGKISTEGGTGRVIFTIILVVFAAALAYLAYRGLSANENGLATGSFLAMAPPVWLAWRLWEGSGIGGVVETENGFFAEPLFFLQTSPFNNFWLMVVLIWIQTGFAMVIMSAAIKAVPAELIEASKVDGATESQTFWGVTIPQISSTIGVVVTTLIVLVMKVFDIVKVMTNGNFDTQVLANEMWQKAFTESDFGVGSAVAVVLFISVLPVMYINIRRMQEEGA
ncbi:MAG: sugar ABC transporter permease [Acidimicrobiia bacterium]|nr:sugar ABC transporter permease [Acidimicrobiia bacterium]